MVNCTVHNSVTNQMSLNYVHYVLLDADALK